MHPENIKRLEVFEDLPITEVPDGSQWPPLVHNAHHIERVRAACESSAHLDPDTMTSPHSYEAAVRAVGATVLASEQGDFALVRPPGHHADPHRATGFCLFNNVAIAAQRLADQGKRVFIFDFDGHLGDGTSHIFEESDQVLYCSIHQYPAFPGHGYVNEIGTGNGRGYTINLPLPAESGDDIFMDAVNTCTQILEQFKPDVVAVSAGFDAHQYDLLLQLRATESSFYKIGRLLRERSPNIFATLEGGYNVAVLPQCVYNFMAGVNGDPMPFDRKETSSSRSIWEEYELRSHTLMGNLRHWWKFW
ncbi:MAG: histone deacetylase [Saprospiraceae bacterium]|nr:histone deacetylase [Saprospiraceae bacterium]